MHTWKIKNNPKKKDYREYSFIVSSKVRLIMILGKGQLLNVLEASRRSKYVQTADMTQKA